MMSEERSRVLTLVFTDLADSTALKSSKGDSAVDALLTRHREHVTRLAEECAGRVIDWAGDGCFLTFETSSAGVLFALQLQKAHSDELDLPGVRIGIHLGEVTERTGPDGTVQVKGLAVDVAARIEGLAKPGQVLMSSSVYNSARQRMGVEAMGMPLLWQLHGTYELKGFDTPLDIGEAGIQGVAPLGAPTIGDKARLIRKSRKQPSGEFKDPRRHRLPLWGVAVIVVLLGAVGYLAWERFTTSPASAPAGPAITSLAVLPLDNLMNDPEQDYFVDGMTEAITAELSKISSLKVISRTSAMTHKNTDKRLPEIAEELDVRGLIEGSVMREDDTVQIRVTLYDGPNEQQLWTGSYPGSVDNVFKLHGDVAFAIAEGIRATVSPDEKSRIAAFQSVNPRSYELYLRGQDLAYSTNLAEMERALELFEQSVAIDPGFPAAYTAISDTHLVIAGTGMQEAAQHYAKAKEAAQEAIRVDETFAFGYQQLGLVALFHDLDFVAAEAYLDKAIALDPNMAVGYVGRAHMRAYQGRGPETVANVKKAVQLDPLSVTIPALASITQFTSGAEDTDLGPIRSAVEREPENPLVHITYVANLALAGRRAEAIQAFARIPASDVPPRYSARLAELYAHTGELARAKDLVSKIVENPENKVIPEVFLGRYFVAVDDLDSAFEWFERAATNPTVDLMYLRFSAFEIENDASAQHLLQDPRYWDLLDRLNFPHLPPSHPAYEFEQEYRIDKAAEALLEEQEWRVIEKAEELIAERGLVPAPD